MVDDKNCGYEEMAAQPNAMDLRLVRGRMVQSAQTTDGGGDKEGGAGLAAVERGGAARHPGNVTWGRGERALAMVAGLAAVDGLYCEDRESIRAWKDLGTCSRRLAGGSTGMGGPPELSEQDRRLRRWWTIVNVTAARAAHDQLLRAALGLDQRTVEERQEAWRELVLGQGTTGAAGKKG